MTLKTMPIPALAAASACLILSIAQAGTASPDPDPLAEVVISATLRSATLEELPASATVLDAPTLERAGVEHFGDVLGLVPNLNWAGGTSRPRYFQLRGIGELEQYEGAPNPSVGFLIDDIDFSGVAMPATLFDAAKVEVLRGPQGTAYGANALAGLISLTTQAPRDDFELRAAADLGDYGVRGGGLVYNDTLGTGEAAYRIVAHAYRGDGFRRDAFLGRDDTNGFDESLLRGKLRWQLGSELKLDLTAMFADIDDGYDAWTLDNSRVTLSDKPGRDMQRSRAVAARLEYDGFDLATLRSTTSFADSDIYYSFDGDWANDTYWGVNGPYDFTERIIRNRRSMSQELRAVSKSPDARIRWVGGIYALRLTEDNDLLDLYNGDIYRSLVSDYAATNLALYGQIDADLTPRLGLSIGLRGERRDARYNDSDAQRFDPVDTMAGGHVALTFKLREGRDLYAALTRGYKAGGFNTGGAVPQNLKLFDPEFLWNLETGIKSRSADGSFDGQLSLFYMRREDQQVSSSYQADPNNPLDFVLLTDNAARGENFGLEGQLGWRPLPGLRLSSSLGLLKARFLEYQLAGVSLDGRDQPHAPHYQFSLSADYRFARGLFARADVTGSDAFYFSASHDERSVPYQLVNLRLGYEAQNWMVSLWARNVFDERYYVRGFYFANEPGLGPKRYLDNGDPRQIGMSVSLSF
ncbi:MAG TPA: TonB-dependent receptor plug domain-containing protein [Steroidobacteraceae bacterium]|nr:TonB-dependent receptor plug domain-containing protein [Steroidobacteraceae bacterium]